MPSVKRRASTILNEYGAAQSELIGKAVVLTDGKAGRVVFVPTPTICSRRWRSVQIHRGRSLQAPTGMLGLSRNKHGPLTALRLRVAANEGRSETSHCCRPALLCGRLGRFEPPWNIRGHYTPERSCRSWARRSRREWRQAAGTKHGDAGRDNLSVPHAIRTKANRAFNETVCGPSQQQARDHNSEGHKRGRGLPSDDIREGDQWPVP